MNDEMQALVGKSEGELMAAWGAPYSSYRNKDGTSVVSWRELWTSYSSTQGSKTEVCTKTVMVDEAGIVSRWNHHNCQVNRNGTVSASIPVPRPSL